MRIKLGREVEDGRRRRTSSLAGPFASDAATAIATSPREAAARPRDPRKIASTPETSSHNRE